MGKPEPEGGGSARSEEGSAGASSCGRIALEASAELDVRVTEGGLDGTRICSTYPARQSSLSTGGSPP